VKVDFVAEWLAANLGSSTDADVVVQLTNLQRCVTIRENLGGKDVRISGCEDSYIYIDSAVDFLSVSNCSNTTVLCAAVAKSATVQKCEKSVVTVAAKYLRVGNSVDCNVFSYCVMGPPIIYGDSRSLQLGPFNAGFNSLAEHLAQADLPFAPPQATPQQMMAHRECSTNFLRPVLLLNETSGITFVQAQDFMRLSLP